ncbi:2OG-Fe(II) oxygenase [Cyanobium sp. CH-040]|uniref:prolyl hydroxylase family protein n=1 Tax=Cyanobium sp. CH-040 TaxID=2823708 RepID=UPI0020CEC725|nr:2OG-Fe(II) oxygenase [Cyanobium sp. CH-040]MCP9928345.1 2OG-Fe(II) oxygenase [Cyanobium sp. CH-040]
MTAAPLDSDFLFQAMMAPPLTRPEHRPRAWRLDTPLAQIYEIPGMLSRRECRELIEAIDRNLERSKTAKGISDHRTSQTCYLAYWEPDLAARIDRRCAELIGIDPIYSDPLQGQRYEPGQSYGGHTDWFSPDDPVARDQLIPLGQRTWTVMIYLNAVEEGGQTIFHRLGRRFEPLPGVALAWNNLHADGRGNPYTLHGSLKVVRGVKYIITKWFRQHPRSAD